MAAGRWVDSLHVISISGPVTGKVGSPWVHRVHAVFACDLG